LERKKREREFLRPHANSCRVQTGGKKKGEKDMKRAGNAVSYITTAMQGGRGKKKRKGKSSRTVGFAVWKKRKKKKKEKTSERGTERAQYW